MIKPFLTLGSGFGLLFVFLFSLGLANAQNKQPYLVFEGSKSPDGCYALAWGVKDSMIGASGVENLSDAEYSLIENYLVNLKSRTKIATVGSGYFPGKNHGEIAACWRDDSRAVMIVEGGKWTHVFASVVYVVDPEADWNQCSDVIPLDRALHKTISAQILKEHPKEHEAIKGFAIAVSAEKWTGENQVLLSVTGEIPKALDSFFYEGKITVTLPGPDMVFIAGESARGKPSSGDEANINLITASSAGAIKLGMTVSEARRVMRGATFSRSSDGDGLTLIDVGQPNSDPVLTLYAGEEDPDSRIDDGAVIEFIQVWDSSFKTAEGAFPAMTLRNAEKHYGKIREIIMSEVESREYATFTNQPSGLSFRLIHPNHTAGNYRNGEMTTSRYMPGAKIFCIEVSGANVMNDGSIGGIAIGYTEAEVLDLAKKGQMGEVFKGKDEMWEAFGQAVQKWIFPQAGISVDMISDKIGGPKTVLSITAKAPSSHKTGAGIGLGDPKIEVVRAYADYKADSEEMDGFFEGEDVHLVGSIYGGMVFTFTDGALIEIYLGASAE